jgi:putative tryptophan/tyrosine transport system substrate-binding protein
MRGRPPTTLELLFLVVLAFAVLATGLRAQPPNKVYRIAVMAIAPISIEGFRIVTLEELAKLGFVEGRNLVVTTHVGPVERIQEMAREAMATRPDVVVAYGGILTGLAAKAASSTVPIVFLISNDPIGTGLAKSFARPGGNVTGFTIMEELDVKRLLLLHEAIPSARRMGFLAHRPPRHDETIKELQRVAEGLGIETHVFRVDEPSEYLAVFGSMRLAGIQALTILAAPEFNRDATLLSQLSIEAGLPTVCEWATMARGGCLIGYGPSLAVLRHRIADYVARILHGTPPSELPIEQPARFEFAINLKTAKRLGLELPPPLLARADEVIE